MSSFSVCMYLSIGISMDYFQVLVHMLSNWTFRLTCSLINNFNSYKIGGFLWCVLISFFFFFLWIFKLNLVGSYYFFFFIFFFFFFDAFLKYIFTKYFASSRFFGYYWLHIISDFFYENLKIYNLWHIFVVLIWLYVSCLCYICIYWWLKLSLFDFLSLMIQSFNQ